MPNHKIQISVNGRLVDTLEDILPEEGEPLKILFIAKVPTQDSVEAGHYFQGRQGKMLWRKLKEYGILIAPEGKYEDDFLLENNYGFIDVIKVPRQYGKEPYSDEYKKGTQRVIDIIERFQPKVVVFIYKKVIDKVMLYGFKKKGYKSEYGFNKDAEEYFNCKVFGFPMPGTPCRSIDAQRYMNELNEYLYS